MLNPWVRVLMWAVVALFVLLFFSIMNAASASTLIIKDGVATMSEEDFNKMTAYIRSVEANLNRAAGKAELYKYLYSQAEACAKQSAVNTLPILPCFNQDNKTRSMTGDYMHPNLTSD